MDWLYFSGPTHWTCATEFPSLPDLRLVKQFLCIYKQIIDCIEVKFGWQLITALPWPDSLLVMLSYTRALIPSTPSMPTPHHPPHTHAPHPHTHTPHTHSPAPSSLTAYMEISCIIWNFQYHLKVSICWINIYIQRGARNRHDLRQHITLHALPIWCISCTIVLNEDEIFLHKKIHIISTRQSQWIWVNEFFIQRHKTVSY